MTLVVVVVVVVVPVVVVVVVVVAVVNINVSNGSLRKTPSPVASRQVAPITDIDLFLLLVLSLLLIFSLDMY